MNRILSVCALPRGPMGSTRLWVRRAGGYMLALNATHPNFGLPYGCYPRLIFAWMCTEAVRTRTPKLVLGRSLNEFLTKLGIKASNSGGRWGVRTRVRDQMERLFACAINLEMTRDHKSLKQQTGFVGGIAERRNLWWAPRNPDQPMLFTSTIELNHLLFVEIVSHAVPINLLTLRAMRRSPLGIDLYLWITYRTFRLTKPLKLSWRQIYLQFGAAPEQPTKRRVDNFRRKALREIFNIRTAWPELAYRVIRGGVHKGHGYDGYLVLEPTPPQSHPKTPGESPSFSPRKRRHPRASEGQQQPPSRRRRHGRESAPPRGE